MTRTFVVRKKLERPEARLFVIPFAGGGASAFHDWHGRILPGVEVAVVQLPGREDRIGEPPLRRIDEIICWLAGEMRPLLDVPCALFGHSMGGLIAYELARSFTASGKSPVYLQVSARNAPDCDRAPEQLHRLPDARLIERLFALGGITREGLENRELVELMLPIWRADIEACETYVYRPGEPLPCAISVFGAIGDPETDPAGLRAWERHTRRPIELRMYPGDHFFIHRLREQVLGAVARDLRLALAGETTTCPT